jgi:hypothetical protein
MRHLLLFLLFLLIPLLNPKSILAVCPTTCGECTTLSTCLPPCVWNTFCYNPTPTVASTPTPAPTPTTTPTPQISPLEQAWNDFWNWLFGLFVKTDYTISARSLSDVNSDMTDYGNIGATDTSFDQKHSFAGSRLTDSGSQTCLKGNVIRQVILGTLGYPNSDLSKICFNQTSCTVEPNTTDPNCLVINVKSLAHYFVQIKQNFYCDYINNTNQLMEIETDFVTKVQALGLPYIPELQKKCYQQIYDDFYITPKDNTNDNEENAKKIVQTPLSAENQDSTLGNKKIRQRVDQNFTPFGTANPAGLYGLRPENDK